jgi:hypothetical protein
MPYFKPFPAADESALKRFGGRAQTVVRRCTRTEKGRQEWCPIYVVRVGRGRRPKLLEVLEAPNRHVVDYVQKLSGTDRTPLLFRSGTPSGGAPTMAAYNDLREAPASGIHLQRGFPSMFAPSVIRIEQRS